MLASRQFEKTFESKQWGKMSLLLSNSLSFALISNPLTLLTNCAVVCYNSSYTFSSSKASKSLRMEGAIWLDFQNFQPKGRLFKSEFFAGGLQTQVIFCQYIWKITTCFEPCNSVRFQVSLWQKHTLR